MSTEGFNRKLTAILSADVVGYSRLMGDDEELTIRTLTGHREMMSALIEKHRGRVIDSPGDNLLAAFSSVTQAVECAVEIQREMAERNEELPDDRKMEYRIGVNLGDVIEEGDRIYGDGVNIAARLESLAEPGGICISSFVYNQIKNRLKLEYEFIGDQTVKNIKEPVPVYRVLSFPAAAAHRVIKAKEIAEKSWRNRIIIAVASVVVIFAALALWNFYLRGPSIEPASVERMAYPLPDKPSIAVLPFTNMSGDPEQEYIGDGLSENIISALSVSSNIFIMARNSTFAYKGTPVTIRQVAEDLGVQYVLEGSVQKSGDQLRVTAQFIDALSGHHLWSEVYDREMKNLFELQDEITKKIVVSLQVELGGGEDTRISAKSTDNLEAWKHYIKGVELLFKFIKEDNVKAREHLEAAIEFDPDFVAALSVLAITHFWDMLMEWSDSPSNSLNRAFELALQAVELDEQDPAAHAVLGYIYLNKRQHEKSITELKRAITLNPNYAEGNAFLARTMFFSGRFDEALTLMNKAFRLNPNLHPTYLATLAKIYIFLGRYEEALEVCNEMEELASRGKISPLVPPLILSWVYAEIGREEEARACMAEVLKIVPVGALEAIKRGNPFKNPAHLQRTLDARRKAGLPDAPSTVP